MNRLLSFTAICMAVLLLSLDSAWAQAQPPLWSNTGATTSGFAGRAVAIIGDLNGDGLDEYLVGEPEFVTGGGTANGRFIVFNGATGTALAGHGATGASNDRLGFSAVALGDVNANGTPDYAVGALQGFVSMSLTRHGYVRVYDGNGTLLRTLTLPAAPLVVSGAGFGHCVANLGDVDGDGTNDLAVGAPRAGCAATCSSGSGSVTVYSGATLASTGASSYTLAGGGNEDFGWSIDGIGDLDADGNNDILVGAPQSSSGSGLVYVFSGLAGTLIYPLSVNPSPTDEYGYSVSRAGDVDMDGTEDYLVGAPQLTVGGGGYVRLISGSTFLILATFTDSAPYGTLPGSTCISGQGISVRGIGDWNGDGFPDFALGASGDCYSAPDSQAQTLGTGGPGPWYQPPAAWGAPYYGFAVGSVRIMSGFSGNVLKIFSGSYAGSNFGLSIEAGGDVNGDGFADIIIGAPSGTAATTGYAEVESGAYEIGQVYGYSLANSASTPAILRASGSFSISENNLIFTVTGLPASTMVRLYFGTNQLSSPAAVSSGLNWIGNPVTRLTAVSASGTYTVTLNLAAAPFTGVVTPGTEFAFAFSYTDGARTNFTDAVNVGFLP